MPQHPRWDEAEGKYIWEEPPAAAPEVPTFAATAVAEMAVEDVADVPSEDPPRVMTLERYYPSARPINDVPAEEPESVESSEATDAILAVLPKEVPNYIRAVLMLLLGAHRVRPKSD